MLTQKRYSQEEFISFVLNKKKNKQTTKNALEDSTIQIFTETSKCMYDYVEVYLISLTFNVKLINSTF